MSNALKTTLLFSCVLKIYATASGICEFKIIGKDNNQPLKGTLCVYNDTILTSTVEGTLTIICNTNDTLIFKQIGYLEHTVIVNPNTYNRATIIKLEKFNNTLQEVSVFGEYQLTPQMIANANRNVQIAVYQSIQNSTLSVMDDPSTYYLENIINSSGHHGISAMQSFSFSTQKLRKLRKTKSTLPTKRIISLEEYQSKTIK